jgi:hypothetical protein
VAGQQRQITQLQGQLAKATATVESLQVEVEREISQRWDLNQKGSVQWSP